MILEYLLKELAEKERIEKYKPKGVDKRLYSVSDRKCWYIQFSADGENEETAKLLSEVDEYVGKSFQVTVLENGSAAYFNKRLYPLVSGFEYKLRKLLYLKCALYNDKKAVANIIDLESKDFGCIFTLLFIDNEFMKSVKNSIQNRKQEVFSKADVLSTIEAIEENTLWDALLGKDSVPLLRRRFTAVRNYRNDVMHSHNISWKQFREIFTLFKNVNKELNMVLHDIETTENTTQNTMSFNEALYNALQVQEQASEIASLLKPSIEGWKMNPEFRELVQGIITPPTISPNMKRMLSQTAAFSKETQPLEEISEILKQYNCFRDPGTDFSSVAKAAQEAIQSQMPSGLDKWSDILRNKQNNFEISDSEKDEERTGVFNKTITDNGGTE